MVIPSAHRQVTHASARTSVARSWCCHLGGRGHVVHGVATNCEDVLMCTWDRKSSGRNHFWKLKFCFVASSSNAPEHQDWDIQIGMWIEPGIPTVIFGIPQRERVILEGLRSSCKSSCRSSCNHVWGWPNCQPLITLQMAKECEFDHREASMYMRRLTDW